MTGSPINDAIERILIPAETLRARVAELAAQVSADYAGREILLVCVLRGAVFFMADLARALTVPCALDFMAVSSYGSATDSSGVVRILKDLDADIADRHVLIVEDIIDSGLTLNYLLKSLSARHPASLEICALLTKPSRRRIQLGCKYVGFEIANEFVVGYGLDLAERFRALDYIGTVKPEVVAELTGDASRDS
jgi:hypoxanthine phosphoribosyltransferase